MGDGVVRPVILVSGARAGVTMVTNLHQRRVEYRCSFS